MRFRFREPLREETAASVAKAAAVAVAYFLAARLGVSMALASEPVSLVWPASGIGLAAVLLLGPRAGAAIAAGSFAANAVSGVATGAALLMAVGAAGEALAAAWLLVRLVRFDPALARFSDVGGLIVVAAGVVPVTAALLGPLALCLDGQRPWDAFGALWREWWFGDAIGIFVVAPVLLAWSDTAALVRGPRRLGEAALLGLLLLLACVLTYGAKFDGQAVRYPIEYVTFPFLVWAALRFGPAVTAAVTFVVAVIAVAATFHGEGPFQGGSVGERLVLVELYVLVMSVTGLFLGAEMAGRRRAEDRLRADHLVGSVLAASRRLSEASLHVVRSLCEALRWDFGAMWVLDRDAGTMRCADAWREPRASAHEFEALTRCLTFAPGEGLPGRVWETRRPCWIADVAREARSPRAAAARRAGLHAAFAFPLLAHGEVVGVVELFQRRPVPPDRRLLHAAASIGGRVGQFIERTNVEARLRESEERFRILAETVPSIVWIASASGGFLYANPRWREYSGPTVPPQSWADVVHPDDRERCLAAWRSALVTGEPFQIETRNRRHDGEYHWFLTRAMPRKDDRGRVLSWFGVTTDVHEAKLTEARLREADRRKDEFLATLAHELRNPLAPVSNALHVLASAGDDGKLRAEALCLARRQLDALVRLVDDLLDVSRIARGKIRIRRERVLLAELVARAVETVEPLAANRRQRLVVELPAAPLWLDADPTRIAQVISNLLNNATKYSDAGATIRVSALAGEGGVAELVVADDGIGIPAEMLERIFEPFVQGDHTADRAQGGLGVGLTLVRQLVTMHGGTVVAQSDGRGRGSRLVVKLPLAPTAAETAAPVVRSTRATADGAAARRVLVVDDNPDSAATMRLVLEAMGHAVRVAHDGEEGVAAAAEFAPDVVLLDIGLPKMNGYDAARAIRAAARGPGPLLVAVTGWDRPEDRARSREAGFDHHVTKPIVPDTLRKLIEASRAPAEPVRPL